MDGDFKGQFAALARWFDGWEPGVVSGDGKEQRQLPSARRKQHKTPIEVLDGVSPQETEVLASEVSNQLEDGYTDRQLTTAATNALLRHLRWEPSSVTNLDSNALAVWYGLSNYIAELAVDNAAKMDVFERMPDEKQLPRVKEETVVIEVRSSDEDVDRERRSGRGRKARKVAAGGDTPAAAAAGSARAPAELVLATAAAATSTPVSVRRDRAADDDDEEVTNERFREIMAAVRKDGYWHENSAGESERLHRRQRMAISHQLRFGEATNAKAAREVNVADAWRGREPLGARAPAKTAPTADTPTTATTAAQPRDADNDDDAPPPPPARPMAPALPPLNTTVLSRCPCAHGL